MKLRSLLAAAAFLLPAAASAQYARMVEGPHYSVVYDAANRCVSAMASAALPAHILCQDGALLWRRDELQWYKSTNFVWSTIQFSGSITWPLLAPDGSAAAPSYSFASQPTSGLYYNPSGTVTFLKAYDASGTDVASTGRATVTAGAGTGTGTGGNAAMQVCLPSTSSGSSLNACTAAFFASGTDGEVIVGNLSSLGSLSTNSLRGNSRTAGALDGSAGGINLDGGKGTGTGNGGSVSIQIAPPDSSSGTTQNTLQVALQATGSGGAVNIGGVNVEGTPGASTWAGADRASGITDGSGGGVTIRGGQGTNAGNGGTLLFQVAPPDSSSGSVQNALQTGLSISGINGAVNIGGIDVETLTAAASTWDGTSAASGMTDAAGGSVSVRTGQGTGAGLGGAFLAQLAPAGASGTSQNTYQSFINVTAAGVFDIGGLDIIGSPGTSTWGGSDRATGVSNGSGGALAIRTGVGTGTGVGGDMTFHVALPGGSGSSQNSYVTPMSISGTSGHVLMPASGTAPALSSCGTSPSIVGGDHAGKVTVGSGGTVQSCTLTFNKAYTVAPACVANTESQVLVVRAVSTTTTLTIDCAVAGCLESDVVSYICIQGS